MNQIMKSPTKVGLLLGTTFGVIVVSIGVLRYQTGMLLRGDHTLSYVYWGIFTVSIFLVLLRMKRQNPTAFSLKQNFKVGLLAGLLSGLIYTLYITILNNCIDIGLLTKVEQLSKQILLAENAQLTKAQIEQSFNPSTWRPELRGFVYTGVCMLCGLIHATWSTLVINWIGRTKA